LAALCREQRAFDSELPGDDLVEVEEQLRIEAPRFLRQLARPGEKVSTTERLDGCFRVHARC